MSNQVELHAREMELSDKIKSHVQKKAGNLDHYLPAIEQATVQFTNQKSARSAMDRNVAEITVRGKGMILRAEERAEDPLKAFDAAFDDLQRQIERYKGKHYRNMRGADSAKRAAAAQEFRCRIPRHTSAADRPPKTVPPDADERRRSLRADAPARSRQFLPFLQCRHR